MPAFELSGRGALVTGASSGIGAGVARAFAAAGARVAINHPGGAARADAEGVAEALSAAGADVLVVEADVAEEDAVAAMVARVEESFGALDILVNNAGFATTAPVHELSAERFDRLLAVHLRGTFLCTRAALPGMYARNYGRIINTASQLAYRGAPVKEHLRGIVRGEVVRFTLPRIGALNFVLHDALAGGVTRSLALELGESDITANCVAPGATRTPILDGVPEAVLEAIRQTIPKGRLAEVEDIVPAYLFLASEQARHVVGQCISPNGGDVFL